MYRKNMQREQIVGTHGRNITFNFPCCFAWVIATIALKSCYDFTILYDKMLMCIILPVAAWRAHVFAQSGVCPWMFVYIVCTICFQFTTRDFLGDPSWIHIVLQWLSLGIIDFRMFFFRIFWFWFDFQGKHWLRCEFLVKWWSIHFHTNPLISHRVCMKISGSPWFHWNS